MKKSIRGFTLVELIVVVTILAILGTIGFVSYSSYLTGVRDANRTASMESISNGLSLYTTAAKDLPIPDQATEIQSGSTVAYQGQAGTTVLESIDYNKAGVDPKDKIPYGYLIDANRTYHQLVGFAEESDTAIAYDFLFNKAHAVDLSLRYPIFYGNKLGMFIENTVDFRPLDASIVATLDVSGTYSAGAYDIHFDADTSTSTITSESYVNTLSVSGIVTSCAVLNAKKSLISTGSYLTSDGGVSSTNCGPSS